MDDIRKKLDEMAKDIVEIKVSTAEINTTLIGQRESLDYHIMRTDLLEDKVLLLKESVDKSKGMKDLIIFLVKVSSVLIAAVTAFKKFF